MPAEVQQCTGQSLVFNKLGQCCLTTIDLCISVAPPKSSCDTVALTPHRLALSFQAAAQAHFCYMLYFSKTSWGHCPYSVLQCLVGYALNAKYLLAALLWSSLSTASNSCFQFLGLQASKVPFQRRAFESVLQPPDILVHCKGFSTLENDTKYSAATLQFNNIHRPTQPRTLSHGMLL